MNIKEAKEQIKNAMTAYFTKDKNGEYIIPVEKQRPIFLMGPPGIGKTAIMEQIAAEMGVGLLSYSMTHHTRQSALGLPFIEHKIYKGKEYDISEYTMSEIIAAVYDMMEETGIEEGILFLDEINCVSETLAPVMLQFLQYKVFGRHCVPAGWIVVTAGNPPEYNNSVREFDIVTWDRLKRIDIEPDLGVWKEYAFARAVHPAVLTYLDIKRTDFYKVESNIDGKTFITARGWEDLSQMIKLYEMHGIAVNEKLTSQYIQNKKISRSFAMYYDLFNKYKSDYQVDKILDGKETEEIAERAKKSKFDERLALIRLLLDAVSEETKAVINEEKVLKETLGALKSFRTKLTSEVTPKKVLGELTANTRKRASSMKTSSSGSKDKISVLKETANILSEYSALIENENDPKTAFGIIKEKFDNRVKNLSRTAENTKKKLSNMFSFLEKVFGEGQEILIVITELTSNVYTAGFIGKYGCDEYFRHNKELLFYERQKEIIAEIESLEEL